MNHHVNNFNHQQWGIPLIDFTLKDDEIHIWRVFLNAPLSNLQAQKQFLSLDEVTRAKQFRFERDQNHFIRTRGVLRYLLGHYLKTEPSRLRFEYTSYGKPSLAFPFDKNNLRFNLSHSHEIALYAFTYNRQIGIDIEYMRSDIDYDELARYSFSSHEQTHLIALPITSQRQGFFNCWTRKEAYIKARGLGLSLPLHLFDVSLQPGEPAALLASREDPHETTRWSFFNLWPHPDYAAALVVEGKKRIVQQWQWSDVITFPF